MADLGKPIWSVSWKEQTEWLPRILLPLVAMLMVTYVWATKVMHLGDHEWSWWATVPAPIVGVVLFLVLGPEEFTNVLGEGGVMVSRKHNGFFTRRLTVRFADVDDIETKYTRIVSDAHSQIYARTKVEISFLDRQGKNLLDLEGEFIEPWQQQNGWTPGAAVDLSLAGRLNKANEARLGFDAMAAFDKFKDFRGDGVYR